MSAPQFREADLVSALQSSLKSGASIKTNTTLLDYSVTVADSETTHIIFFPLAHLEDETPTTMAARVLRHLDPRLHA